MKRQDKVATRKNSVHPNSDTMKPISYPLLSALIWINFWYVHGYQFGQCHSPFAACCTPPQETYRSCIRTQTPHIIFLINENSDKSVI